MTQGFGNEPEGDSLKETTGDGLYGSFPDSLRTSKSLSGKGGGATILKPSFDTIHFSSKSSLVWIHLDLNISSRVGLTTHGTHGCTGGLGVWSHLCGVLFGGPT